MPPGGADCHRGARFATGGPNKLAEYKAAAAEATVASSHCGRNRMLAVDLAASHPLGGLKCSLGDLKCCDAGLRPLRAGSPGLQRFNAESCLQGNVEGRRSSSAGGLGLQRMDFPCCDGGFRPLRAGSQGMQRFNAASWQQGARIDTGGRGLPPGGADCHRGARIVTGARFATGGRGLPPGCAVCHRGAE